MGEHLSACDYTLIFCPVLINVIVEIRFCIKHGESIKRRSAQDVSMFDELAFFKVSCRPLFIFATLFTVGAKFCVSTMAALASLRGANLHHTVMRVVNLCKYAKIGCMVEVTQKDLKKHEETELLNVKPF